MAHEVEPVRVRAARPEHSSAQVWERRFWLALGVAGGLHGAMALALRHPALPARVHHEPRDYLEVSLVEDAPTTPADDSVAAQADVAAQRERVAALGHAPTKDAVVSEPAVPAETAETAPADTAAVPPIGSAAGEPGAPRGSLSLDALGIGSANPFLGMRGFGVAPAAPPTPPAASSDVPDRTRVAEQRLKRYLVAGMMEHDRATGASRNGAVVTALRDAALLVTSPVNGQAEFVATIDATGLVTALRPTRVSSNVADWRNVAARALKELAKRRLRVPAGAAGLEVRLALSSKIQLPSGSTSLGAMHTVPLLNNDGTRLSRLELPPESNKLPDQSDPGALGTPLLKQPIPGGGIDGDLADIGGVGHRIVHVAITDERPL